MDDYVYTSVNWYFHVLEKTGYVSQPDVNALLVLIFFYDFIYRDYRGYISRDDYKTIERAMNCLYGKSCLIPYPAYLKMGKLKLGEVSEILSRTKALEKYSGVLDKRITDNDVLIADNIRRLDEHGTRLDEHDRHLALLDDTVAAHQQHLEYLDGVVEDHEGRIQVMEQTRVIKRKGDVGIEILDIVIDGEDDTPDAPINPDVTPVPDFPVEPWGE